MLSPYPILLHYPVVGTFLYIAAHLVPPSPVTPLKIYWALKFGVRHSRFRKHFCMFED